MMIYKKASIIKAYRSLSSYTCIGRVRANRIIFPEGHEKLGIKLHGMN